MKTQTSNINKSKRNRRYAAKLLFQWRVVINGDSGKRRLCEERIIIITAPDGKKALTKAKQIGRSAYHRSKNDEKNIVHFEFVGILDLLHLGISTEKNEVWYDIVEKLQPMERRAKIIPSESDLCAIRNKE